MRPGLASGLALRNPPPPNIRQWLILMGHLLKALQEVVLSSAFHWNSLNFSARASSAAIAEMLSAMYVVRMAFGKEDGCSYGYNVVQLTW